MATPQARVTERTAWDTIAPGYDRVVTPFVRVANQDPATTELFEEGKKKGKTGYCFFKSDPSRGVSSDEMIDYWTKLVARWPIASIELWCRCCIISTLTPLGRQGA